MATIAIIGSGFSSLSAAAYLAKAGHEVTIYEKNSSPGGRCRQYTASGFVFDMGPSWYWMPEVFDHFFEDFGHKTSDFYHLERLSPSYTVHFANREQVDVPSDFEDLKALFESMEPGAASKLEQFIADAQQKYIAGMERFVHKPSLSILEFANYEILSGLVKLDLLKAFSKHVRNYFSHPKIVQILEFPVLFLGATPQEIPALYSMMNFADLKGGTWYPQKGMYEIIKAMVNVCTEQGVHFHYDAEVTKIHVDKNQPSKATGIMINGTHIPSDYVIAGADYHHVDQQLLEAPYRNYSPKYWDSRKMAPSALIYYIGLNKKIDRIHHHNLFFDTDFDAHAAEIYTNQRWPENPLFYICAPSVTDATVAPEGCENLFLLVPIAPGLSDTETDRTLVFEKVMKRMEEITGQAITDHIVYKRSYAVNDFIADYHAYKGNAYGLANTLRQTAFLKPKIRNKKLKNVYYAGQLTVPGPGVPPSIISGKVVAAHLTRSFNT